MPKKKEYLKIIGEQKITTFGKKERLKDFPDLMKVIQTQIDNATKKERLKQLK